MKSNAVNYFEQPLFVAKAGKALALWDNVKARHIEASPRIITEFGPEHVAKFNDMMSELFCKAPSCFKLEPR